jgi:flagellar hook assembly protein FlgD
LILGTPSSGGRKHYDVRAEVFDITGRSVRTVLSGSLPAGRHVVEWDGRTASGPRAGAGIYFMRVTVDGRVAGTVKIVRIP